VKCRDRGREEWCSEGKRMLEEKRTEDEQIKDLSLRVEDGESRFRSVQRRVGVESSVGV